MRIFYFQSLIELFVASKAIKNNIPPRKGRLRSGHGLKMECTVVISKV
jgi:hypothetical protein